MSELNNTAAALLSLLHNGPMTGGQLCRSADRFGSFFSLTKSHVYRELPILADAGLVRPGKQGPRASQEYVITAAGKKRFRTWLSEPSGPDHLRSPMILRLVHASALSSRQRHSLVAAARLVYGAEYDAAMTVAPAVTDPYEKAIAEYAVARVKAVLELLDAIPD